jgi:Gpi18-like mannosyltransferase
MLEWFKRSWSRLDPAWRAALITFLAARLFYSLWSLAVVVAIPVASQVTDLGGQQVRTQFDLLQNRGSVDAGGSDSTRYTVEDVFPYRGVRAESSLWLSLWQRFDTNWYLEIAQRGYSNTDGSTAFFPLYPLLIRGIGFLVGNDLLAALLLSNAALLGALVWFYRLGLDLFEPAAVRRAMAYLVIFPTSFFLFAGYTESVFLFFALAAFWTAGRGKWVWTAILGALAAWTRLQGVLLVLPLAYLWWAQAGRRRWRDALVLLAIPLATGVFFLSTRSAMTTDLQTVWQARFLWPWQNVWAAVSRLAGGAGSAADGLNLGCVILFTGLGIWGWKRLPRAWSLYYWLLLLAPLFRMNAAQPLVSMSRYGIVLFPAFYLLGSAGKNPWVNRLIVYAGILAVLYFSAQFFSWGWVA